MRSPKRSSASIARPSLDERCARRNLYEDTQCDRPLSYPTSRLLIKLSIVIWLGAFIPSKSHINRISVLHSFSIALVDTYPNSINANSTTLNKTYSSYLGRPFSRSSFAGYLLRSICVTISQNVYTTKKEVLVSLFGKLGLLFLG